MASPQCISPHRPQPPGKQAVLPPPGLPGFHLCLQPYHPTEPAAKDEHSRVESTGELGPGLPDQKTSRIHIIISSSISLNPGFPQGCVPSPLLFTQLTHDCPVKFQSCHVVNFAYNTALVGHIMNNNDSEYREYMSRSSSLNQEVRYHFNNSASQQEIWWYFVASLGCYRKLIKTD